MTPQGGFNYYTHFTDEKIKSLGYLSLFHQNAPEHRIKGAYEVGTWGVGASQIQLLQKQNFFEDPGFLMLICFLHSALYLSWF